MMKAILIFIMILALSGCGKDDSSQDKESATDPIIYEQPESNGDAIEPEDPCQPDEPDEEPEEDDTTHTPFIWGQSKWGEGTWE